MNIVAKFNFTRPSRSDFTPVEKWSGDLLLPQCVFFHFFALFYTFFALFSLFFTFIICIFIFISQNLEKKYTPLLEHSCKVQFYPPIEKRFYTSREVERRFTAPAVCFFSLFCSFLHFFHFFAFFIILFYNFTLYIICIHAHAGAHAHGKIKLKKNYKYLHILI